MSASQKAYYDYLQTRTWLSFWVRRFFIADLRRHFSGLVLDVGCGLGEFLDQYPKGIGVDINPFVAAHCRRRGHSCGVSGAFPLPFSEQAFDGVLASNLLEHLDSPETAVAEAARVLKPGGVLVITVPLEAGYRHDPTHVRFLTAADLIAIAEASALKARKIYRYPFRPAWPGKMLYFCELRCVFAKG